MSKFTIDEAAPSSFAFAPAPGVGRQHYLTGVDVTVSGATKATIGPVSFHLGVGIAEARFHKPIPCGDNTAILVTAGADLAGLIFYETR